MTEQELREGVDQHMRVVVDRVHEARALPLVLVGCDPDDPHKFRIFPCGPGSTPQAMVAVLRLAADALERTVTRAPEENPGGG